MHIFLSHSSKDAAVAAQICEYLEEKGKRCFLAPRDIRSGREYAEEIIDGIDQSEAMILIMSEHANQSPHVLREVERAVSKSIPILVYKLTDVKLSKSFEYFLMTHQWLNAKPQTDFSDIWDFVKGNPIDKKPRRKRYLYAMPAALLVIFVIFDIFSSILANIEPFICPYEVGDTVTFGNYNDEAIEWRVLKLSEDQTEAVLVSKDILTMKAFDAAESGAYNKDGDTDYWFERELVDADLNLQIRVHGNNDWSVSNIRTWLNSTDEIVAYTDQPPMTSAMSEKRNGYHNEPGFLYDFTEEELAAILPTEVSTHGNVLNDGTITTIDKVYLLSLEELDWFDEAGISKLAVPTDAALEQDQSFWYSISLSEFNIKEFSWWLREPVEGRSSACYMVGNGYTEDNIFEANVGLEGYGIRPAITVDLQADCFAE